MPGLYQARARRIIRPCPAVFVVERIAQRVVVFLPPWRRRVERFAGDQIRPGDEHMQMHAAILLDVFDDGPGITLRIEAGEGQALKFVDSLLDLCGQRLVGRRPGDDAGAIPQHEGQRIGDLGHQVRIAS